MLSAYGERPTIADARAVLADLYRPCRDLAGLSPCDAARAGGEDWRRVLRLYPRKRNRITRAPSVPAMQSLPAAPVGPELP